MKLMRFFPIIILFISASFTNQIRFEQKGYTIISTIKGIPNGTIVYLLRKRGTNSDTVSKTIIKGEKFVFKGKIDLEGEFYTILFDTTKIELKPRYIKLLLDNSTITIRGNVKNWPNVQIVGSVSIGDYLTFVSKFSPKFDSLEIIKDKMNKMIAQFQSQEDSKQTDGLSQLMFNKKTDSLKQIYYKAENNYNEEFVAYINNHPNSLLTPYSIMQVEHILGLKKMEEAYNSLSPKARTSFYGSKLKDRLRNLQEIENAMATNNVGFEIGKIAPDFKGQTPDHEQKSLYQIVRAGKITLLDFWASWCVPCRKSFQKLKIIYNKYHETGFNIITLSTDQNLDDWKKALKHDSLPGIHLTDIYDGESFAKELYKIYKVPTSYLLDSNGKIIAYDLRDEELEMKVQELLSKKDE